MCQGNDHFHEDFGDEPSVEERIPEGWDDLEFEAFAHVDDDGPDELDDDDAQEDFADEDDDFDDDEDFDDDDAAQDRILERQELEDFEGYNPWEDSYGGEG